MFKRFFNFVVRTVKAYVNKHGIIKSIANAIEAAVLSSGIVIYITNAIKRWRTKRKINKIIKNKSEEKVVSSNNILENAGKGVYDENGYRLTSSELYQKNKTAMKDIEELYTDDNRECVELIEKFEPNVFKSMTNDEKFHYVNDNKLTPMKLRKKYGLDKETQLRLGRQQAEELDEAWDEEEEPKISAASRVNGNYHKNLGRKPKITSKKHGVSICSVVDYAAMEITYGCDNFNFTDPNSETQERKLRRLKFEDTVEVVNSYISYIYLYDKPRWKKLMVKANGDATKIWNFMMIAFLDDVKSFNEAKQFLKDKGEELRQEVKGNYRSRRPKITSLEQDELLEKFEDVLERLDLMDNEKKLNRDPNQFIDDDDEDEEDEDEDSDDFNPDVNTSGMEDTDDILDQLDALRSGKTDGFTETPNDEPIERKPVKLITNEPEDDDPTVLHISPKEYTIEKRANLMVKAYDKEYHESGSLIAGNLLTSMLEDKYGKNYKLYEVSDFMKNVRYEDRKKGLSFKLVPSDYSTNEERQEALRDWQAFSKYHGSNNYIAMVKERSEYYQEQFEYKTVDSMLEQLKNIITDHDEQVAFIRCLKEADHDYSNNILSSDCIDLDKEASIPLPIHIQEKVIIDNTDGDPTPEELGVPVSEVQNLHNED